MPTTETDKRSTIMETNMTTEKALYILERHNLWRRGADYVESTDPHLLGMAIDKAIEVLRLSNVSESVCGKCVYYLTCRHESRDKRICKDYDDQP